MVPGKKRHDFIYEFGCLLLHSYLSRKFHCDFETIRIGPSPYIVISNHVTNWDPILIGMSFRKNMYYLATDHIFRMGFKSRMLRFFFSPIAFSKSTQDTNAIITIFRRLKDNCNICIFAEGHTSFNGETGDVQPSIGKLIKKAGVTLVTYRFNGSYFTFPRWARFMRRGKMTGRLGRIYSPEMIAAMQEDEIINAIKADIYVNAYEDQEKNPVAYKGKRPAECLETTLYCCPRCGKFSTLASRDDMLFCSCGLKLRYNEYGCFENYEAGAGEQPPFTTILDWSKWQRNEINTLAEKMISCGRDTPIFTDRDQELFQVARASHNTLLAKGTLSLYNDRLSLVTTENRTIEFPLATIMDMSVITMKTIIFSTKENKLFELHSGHPRSALKYMDMFKSLKAGRE